LRWTEEILMNDQTIKAWCALALSLSVLAGLLLALSAWDAAAARAANGMRYVAPTGSDTANDCADNDAPCKTVQHAVDQAGSGDTILVATGVYTGVHVRSCVTQVVYITKSLTLRGGYTIDWTASDPDANPTILNAEGQGRVLYISGPGITVTVEGLHITGGDAAGGSANGGGIYAAQAAIFLRDNVVYSNTAAANGGGVSLAQCAATLGCNVIRGNTARALQYYQGGGGLYASGGDATLADNVVSGNTATNRGGGVYLASGTFTLIHNTVVHNRGIGREGGGVHLNYGVATLVGNTFRGNEGDWGGGVYADGSTITLTANILVSNTTDVYSGGGVALLNSTATMNKNIIRTNHAHSRGGGVHMYHSDVLLNGNLLFGNTVSGDGGGLFAMGGTAGLVNNVIADNQADDHGAGLTNWNADLHLRQTTLARNEGSAIHVNSGAVFCTNTIVYSHAIGVHVESGAITMAATLWENNLVRTLGVVNESGSFTGTAVFDVDGYHLTAGSQAIDAGVHAGVMSDIDGEPRLGSPDLGADEYVLRVYLPLVMRNG
jgi:parallel beta-helix repeat protein